jgi:hypothetical protein
MRTLPLFALLLIAAPAAADDVTDQASLAHGVSDALGDGAPKLASAATLDFVFERTVRDSLTTKETTAVHRYVRSGPRRQRLDIRVTGGVDSAAIIDGAAAWVVVDGKAHDAEAAAVGSRLPEFAPERIFSVPLALATEGPRILGADALAFDEQVDDAGQRRFVLVGRDAEGAETARLEVDARSLLPLQVAFESPSGFVVYRYDDYRQVAPGLMLPFRREFLRNGIRISTTIVRRLDLDGDPADGLFDRANLALGPLPKGGKAGAKTPKKPAGKGAPGAP